MISSRAAELLIGSHLMILQSKRLMLNSARRRFKESGVESLRGRVEHLRFETDRAQFAYRTMLLGFGSPDRPEYWLVAYGRLIDTAGALVGKIRRAAADLPAAERYEASADVEMLESIIEQWTRSMRESMVASVA